MSGDYVCVWGGGLYSEVGCIISNGLMGSPTPRHQTWDLSSLPSL